MTWTKIFSLAAMAMLATACERHPASELAGEHGMGGHVEADPHAAPAEVPSNPAGAAPVAAAPGDAKEATPAAAPATAPGDAPKFFPGNK